MRLVINHETVRDHVGYVAQRLINAYAIDDKNVGWNSGDLVVHFAGCWVESTCATQFEKYWSKRKTVGEVESQEKVEIQEEVESQDEVEVMEEELWRRG